MELRKISPAVIETAAMTVEERLGALIGAFNANNRDIWDEVGLHSEIICKFANMVKDHDDVISACVSDIAKLEKGMKRKASKLGLALIVIGGIVYVIKNETDKDNMKTKLIELEKKNNIRYDSLEDEGEAINAEEPLGI